MRPSWKIIGLAGVAGVAATGVLVARTRRSDPEYDSEELRDRLHRRLAEAAANEDGPGAPTDGPGAPADGPGAPTDGPGAPTDGAAPESTDPADR